jgi:hypothetical protein
MNFRFLFSNRLHKFLIQGFLIADDRRGAGCCLTYLAAIRNQKLGIDSAPKSLPSYLCD